MRESLLDYTVGRVGPSILGGTIVGCLISGQLEGMHIALFAAGLALILVGWRRQPAPGPA